MIDILQYENQPLKHIQQIGTPEEDERIYVEENVYRRMHESENREHSVFVLMGHTECGNGGYVTFVEGAIWVHEIVFENGAPVWNNKAWNQAFQIIKQEYSQKIIVGWAVNRNGVIPVANGLYEQIHREQFGGAHQILILMNALEGEENVFINRQNHLQKKKGYYLYYRRDALREGRREPKKDDRVGRVVIEYEPKEEYASESSRFSSLAMTVAMVLMIGIFGVGLYRNQLATTKELQPVYENTPKIEEEYEDDTDMTETVEELTPVEVEEVPGNIS